jgi:hypothetical protein
VTRLVVKCPIDDVTLIPMQGSEDFLFLCNGGCKKTWMRRSNGELEEALAPPPESVRLMLPRFLLEQLYGVGASVADVTSASTGIVDRLTKVETSLSSLLAQTQDAGDRDELQRIRDDARTALENARGAQGASRRLQDDLRSLRSAIEEHDIGTLRANVDALETLMRKHLKDHKDGNV